MILRGLRSIGAALQRLPRAACWTLVVAWFGLIFWFSSMPGAKVPSSPLWSVISNLAHAPLFGLFAMWMILLVPRAGGWPELSLPRVRAVLIAIALCGVFDELHQNFFTTGRDMSVFDIGTDLAGASAVLAVVRYAGNISSNFRGLALRVGIGLLACVACATAATFVPRVFPELVWL